MLRSANYINSQILIADEKNTTLQYCKPAQVGVDLTLRKVLAPKGYGLVLRDKTICTEYNEVPASTEELTSGGWHLMPGTYVIQLNEGCAFGPNDTGYIIMRSSLNRNGATIQSAVWDPNYTSKGDDGIYPMSVRLTVDNPYGIFIEKNARVCQLVVATNEDTTLYNGQFQGGNLRGVNS